MVKTKGKTTTGSRLFDVINIVILLLLVLACLYPVWYVFVASFSESSSITANAGKLLWPKGFSLTAYTNAFKHPLIVSGYKNILFILIFSLPLNMLLTLLCAFFMSSQKIMFKKAIVSFFMFTMFFSGGLIPSYLNQRELGLYNNLWALIIPGALSLYNAIICRSAIDAIPDSLIESAYMDGANDFTILFKIITPLIKPTLAVLLLYYGVGHWNGWFSASIYIKDRNLLPIQNVLRAVLLANDQSLNQGASSLDSVNTFAETIKYSAIVISTLPILCIYPFLQKYFIKGVMIGAVKG
ncbi:hypothetical protein IGI37_003516 [Enterococcus sp. AZ194]|uniref:carbohydrate ABC transporter permease n=1 Tax=Enterococcus sp. AZ194 TaxID=2774629 RepID=UPI003F1EEF4C